jgi:hypothetical protein
MYRLGLERSLQLAILGIRLHQSDEIEHGSLHRLQVARRALRHFAERPTHDGVGAALERGVRGCSRVGMQRKQRRVTRRGRV